MKITTFCKNPRTGAVSEEHELRPGYNEFYLPAVCDQRKDMWIKATDENGEEITLHLKW